MRGTTSFATFFVDIAFLSLSPNRASRFCPLLLLSASSRRLLFYNNRRCCGRTALVPPFATDQLSYYRKSRKEGRKGIAINYQCLVTSRALEHALRCYCHPLLFLLLNRNANYYFSSNKGKHCFDSSNGKREREETIDIEINGRRISWTNRGG